MTFSKQTFNSIFVLSILALSIACGQQSKTAESSAQNAPGKGEMVTEIDKSIWVVFQDKQDHYWYGSNGSGVFRYDGKNLRQYSMKDGLPSNQIRDIQEDNNGNMFFDSPNGVAKFDGEKFTVLQPIRSTKNEWKMEADDLWFSGNGGTPGAFRYHNDSLYHVEFAHFFPSATSQAYFTYSICEDSEGKLWFGTLSAGVACFDGHTMHWITEKELSVLDDGRVPAVRVVIEDKNGDFWLSNTLHRYRMHPKDSATQQTLVYDKLPGIQSAEIDLPYFTSAVIGRDNKDLWMSSYNEGVWKYDGENLTIFRPKDGDTHVLIVSIYKDNHGALWLGTDNAGVYRFHGGSFEKFEP
jgi:ligand-binding sensor domain-containing protein